MSTEAKPSDTLAPEAETGPRDLRRPRMEGRVVMVTGGTRGIGAAISQSFAEQGAVVAAGYGRDAEQAQRLLKQLQEFGGKASIHQGNIGSAEDCRRTISEVIDQHGRLDVLVNNAGITIDKTALKMTDEDWYKVLAVNLSGAFFMSQAVVPAMKRTGSGRIVNISSGAGLGISLTGIQAYASAKAGQIGLTRQLAHELGPFGITVNNVAPGFVRSNPTTERQWEAMGEAGQRRLLDNIALKRLGRPEDIAAMVMFFASEYAGWISGQVISVDGGK